MTTERPPVIAVVTDSTDFWDECIRICKVLRAAPWRLRKQDYGLAYAYIRMCAGPYPSSPAFCVIDDQTRGLDPVSLGRQIAKGEPRIPTYILASSVSEGKVTRATLGSGIFVLTHGEDGIERLMRACYKELWPIDNFPGGSS